MTEEEYNKHLKEKDYIQETITKQVDDNHFISYYHSNCIGDTITTFTLYEGDICVPEYSMEIFHCINGEKRYNEQELVEYGKELIKTLPLLMEKVRENDE